MLEVGTVLVGARLAGDGLHSSLAIQKAPMHRCHLPGWGIRGRARSHK